MRLFNLSQNTKLYVKIILNISISIIITLIIPLIFFFNFMTLNIKSDLVFRIRVLTIISIIIGAITTILNLLKYMLNPLSRIFLLIAIGTELIFCILIYLWGQFWVIRIDVENFSLKLDLSVLSMFIYIIPILIIVRIIYCYFITYKTAFNKAIILKIIREGNFNSKNMLRKYISRNLNSELKSQFLINISKTIDDLENYKLIKKRKGYFLSQEGKKLLTWFEKNRITKLETIIKTEYIASVGAYPLQIWTEEDLEKLKIENYKRGKEK